MYLSQILFAAYHFVYLFWLHFFSFLLKFISLYFSAITYKSFYINCKVEEVLKKDAKQSWPYSGFFSCLHKYLWWSECWKLRFAFLSKCMQLTCFAKAGKLQQGGVLTWSLFLLNYTPFCPQMIAGYINGCADTSSMCLQQQDFI